MTPTHAGSRVPGQGSLGPAVERFDRWADDLLEPWRSDPIAAAVFTAASRLGEFSVIWHAANLVRGATAAGRARQIPTLAVLIAAESLVVNQGIKRLFGRTRPTPSGDERFDLRMPTTSAFPSGHASSAAFAATILSAWDGPRSRPLWWGLAGAVAVSRAFVRVHHASDVVGGMVTGRVLGVAVRNALARRHLL